MSTLIVTIHVIVCVALILIVLLQTGKGASMGVSFGGGASQTLFGSSGAGTFLTKLTTGAAVIFMITSLVLAYMSSHETVESVMTEVEAPISAPQEEAAGEATQETTKETQQEATQEAAQVPAPAQETQQKKETGAEPASPKSSEQ
jgi:preprotein translocase subunit SecG